MQPVLEDLIQRFHRWANAQKLERLYEQVDTVKKTETEWWTHVQNTVADDEFKFTIRYSKARNTMFGVVQGTKDWTKYLIRGCSGSLPLFMATPTQAEINVPEDTPEERRKEFYRRGFWAPPVPDRFVIPSLTQKDSHVIQHEMRAGSYGKCAAPAMFGAAIRARFTSIEAIAEGQYNPVFRGEGQKYRGSCTNCLQFLGHMLCTAGNHRRS